MATKAGVIAVTRSKPNKVALVKGSYSGKWGFPKGDIESIETLKDAAFREFREETGINILEPVKDIKLHIKSDTPKVFFVDIVDTEFKMKPQETEVDDAKWIPLSELSNSSEFTYDVRLFYKIINGQSKIPAQRKIERLINSL